MTREQAEKEIRDVFTEGWADEIIKTLEQKSRWIPVRKRLPEENNKDCKIHTPSNPVLVQMDNGEMYVSRYYSRYDTKWMGIDPKCFLLHRVVAWHELPQQWKGDKDA